MFAPRLGPSSPYDPAARQMQQRPQGLLGIAPSFQPAQIDQGLLAQGMQAANAMASGRNSAPTAEQIIQQIKDAQERAKLTPPATSPTDPANTTPAGQSTTTPNPYASQAQPFTPMFDQVLRMLLRR